MGVEGVAGDEEGGGSGGGGGGVDGGMTMVEDGQQGNDGGLLGHRLAPGWPAASSPGEEDGRPDDHGWQPQQAPWESEALDTRILQG
jgi:hypothetical protein